MSTLTSANSSLSLSIAGLFSAPQTIQGFAVDDAFDSDSVAQSETMMGIDGTLSAGKVFTPYKMAVHLLPNSPSMAIFETWRNQQDAQVDVFPALTRFKMCQTISARPRTFNKGLGQCSVSGIIRVPRPAANRMAFIRALKKCSRL